MAHGQEERDFVILRTYDSVWKIPYKIYSIENIKLPFPINPWEAAYFGLGVLIIFLIERILPFLRATPFILRYLLLPFAILKFFTKIKLDGKLPHKFAFDCFIYYISSKKSERFQSIKTKKERIKFVTPVIFRR